MDFCHINRVFVEEMSDKGDGDANTFCCHYWDLLLASQIGAGIIGDYAGIMSTEDTCLNDVMHVECIP